MRRLLLPLIGAALVLFTTGCAGGEDSTSSTTTTTSTAGSEATDTPDQDEAPLATAFTWTTTWDVDGVGYVLTVDGTVGGTHAAYTMQAEPLLASEDEGAGDELTARTAGAAVNGLVEPGGDLDAVDPDGSTEVLVAGGHRWYRSPWLIDEAAFAMDGAEWVHVTGEIDFVADISRHVLVERYDDAVRLLLELVAADAGIQAPRVPADQTEFDAMLTPWIGLTGPGASDGAPAVVTGDVGEGTVTWEQTLTYEPDGADGVLAGEVSWHPADAERHEPPAPGSVIEFGDLAETLGQAG